LLVPDTIARPVREEIVSLDSQTIPFQHIRGIAMGLVGKLLGGEDVDSLLSLIAE